MMIYLAIIFGLLSCILGFTAIRLYLLKSKAEQHNELLKEQLNRDANRDRDCFAALAADVLRINSQQLNEQNRMQISELLAPMKENLDNFRRSYSDAYSKESEKRAMLERQLEELFAINRNIGEETRKLSEVLKGNTSVQGQWGEMILENILERSGLVKGQDYYVQKTVDDPASKARPDVIIRCPGERNIVIDSKVSLTDYIRMLNGADRIAVKNAGESHVASVKKHVAELRRKNYQDLLDGRSPDFVMMFIPHEGAYLAAMQLDNSLWQSAFDSRVIIVSPTHLVSVIKIIEMMWRQDKQNRNALEIAAIGSKIIDKLTNFMGDMAKIKSNITAAQNAYDAAMVKLEGKGGLKSLGETMVEKGIKASIKERQARQ